MSPTFSERIGIIPPKTILSREELTDELRNSLWSAYLINVLDNLSNISSRSSRRSYSRRSEHYRKLWLDFFKLPIDELQFYLGNISEEGPYKYVKRWFSQAPWNRIYDFIDFIAAQGYYEFVMQCNMYLKREFAPFHFVDKQLIEINSEVEIREIESALAVSDQYKPVKTHLASALNLFSDRTSPDYRNTIKESILAVESACKIILGDEKGTLGKMLVELEKRGIIPKNLKAGFSAIYGFASEEGGIRHALLEGDFKISIDEARFMLVACSAFVNYLTSKHEIVLMLE